MSNKSKGKVYEKIEDALKHHPNKDKIVKAVRDFSELGKRINVLYEALTTAIPIYFLSELVEVGVEIDVCFTLQNANWYHQSYICTEMSNIFYDENGSFGKLYKRLLNSREPKTSSYAEIDINRSLVAENKKKFDALFVKNEDILRRLNPTGTRYLDILTNGKKYKCQTI